MHKAVFGRNSWCLGHRVNVECLLTGFIHAQFCELCLLLFWLYYFCEGLLLLMFRFIVLIISKLENFAFKICFTYDPNVHLQCMGKKKFSCVHKIQPFHFYVNCNFVLSFTEAVFGFHGKEIFTFYGAWLIYLVSQS
jgi:hypothetical protein